MACVHEAAASVSRETRLSHTTLLIIVNEVDKIIKHRRMGLHAGIRTW